MNSSDKQIWLKFTKDKDIQKVLNPSLRIITNQIFRIEPEWMVFLASTYVEMNSFIIMITLRITFQQFSQRLMGIRDFFKEGGNLVMNTLFHRLISTLINFSLSSLLLYNLQQQQLTSLQSISREKCRITENNDNNHALWDEDDDVGGEGKNHLKYYDNLILKIEMIIQCPSGATYSKLINNCMDFLMMMMMMIDNNHRAISKL